MNNVLAEQRADLDKPIVVVLTGLDLMRIKGGPNEFNQELLARLKAAGGPVEGLAWLKLKYGALARVKPNLQDQHIGRFRYMWLPPATVAVVAEGIRQEQQLAEWNRKREAERN